MARMAKETASAATGSAGPAAATARPASSGPMTNAAIEKPDSSAFPAVRDCGGRCSATSVYWPDRRELEPVVLHLGQWGTRAPLPEGAHSSLDSLLLALQATADPKAVNGRYEMRLGPDVFTVDGTFGSVRVRRGTADRPEAALTTDAGTLHDVALGKRPIADTVESGDLRFDGDPQAISGLTSLLQALTSSG